MYQLLVYLDPILPTTAVHNLHGNLLELLLVLTLRHFRLNLTSVDVFLQDK